MPHLLRGWRLDMGQTYRKSDTFGDKRRQRIRKKLIKRLKKQKRRCKDTKTYSDTYGIDIPEPNFH